jgi:hypothetical protein
MLISETTSHRSVATFGLIAAFESIRNYTLAIGIGSIAGGILLFINHKRHLDAQLASNANDRVKAFESRKFRRRTAVSAMITSAGFMMAALYWVNEVRVFSVFILMILALLIGILGVALVDLLSVGIQQIASPDDRSQKAMIEAYLKSREEKAKQENEESS